MKILIFAIMTRTWKLPQEELDATIVGLMSNVFIYRIFVTLRIVDVSYDTVEVSYDTVDVSYRIVNVPCPI